MGEFERGCRRQNTKARAISVLFDICEHGRGTELDADTRGKKAHLSWIGSPLIYDLMCFRLVATKSGCARVEFQNKRCQTEVWQCGGCRKDANTVRCPSDSYPK